MDSILLRISRYVSIITGRGRLEHSVNAEHNVFYWQTKLKLHKAIFFFFFVKSLETCMKTKITFWSSFSDLFDD